MTKHEHNPNPLLGIIIFLLVIIILGVFYIGTTIKTLQPMNSKQTVVSVDGGAVAEPVASVDGWTPVKIENTPAVAWEVVKVTVISDVRCGAKCNTTELIGNLKKVPALAWATFEELDYAEESTKVFMQSHNITKLPAAIFPKKNIAELEKYLQPTANKAFTLDMGSTYDPTVKRSAKGFQLVDKKIIEELKADSHIKGDKNAKIFWIEYTDLNCHYCKKMEEDGTAKTVMAQMPKDLNKATSNFIWVGGQKSQIGAEVLECIGKVSWADKYNVLLSKTLISGDSSKGSILKLAKEEWVNISWVEKCLDTWEIKSLVAKKFEAGRSIFGIQWTPGNVLINTETGEYEVVSGAAPVWNFTEVINKLK